MTKPENEEPTKLADKLFNDVNGWDPYLEDLGTLWLLHYQLITRQKASTYGLIFNGLRRDKIVPTGSLKHKPTRRTAMRGTTTKPSTN